MTLHCTIFLFETFSIKNPFDIKSRKLEIESGGFEMSEKLSKLDHQRFFRPNLIYHIFKTESIFL